jgi:hypothetical protein
MASSEFWSLSQREIRARRKVREGYMALWCSEVRNAPYFRKADNTPYTVQDFLGTSPGVPTEDKNGLMFARLQLGLIRQNPELVPDWAKAPYRPPKQKVVAIG